MSEPLNTRINIRPMTVDDIKEVFAIDVLSFSLPWSERSYRYDLLENQAAHMWVGETQNTTGASKLVAMIVIWSVVDEGHIGTLAVHPDHRQQGIARRLLSTALLDIQKAGASKIYLEVRKSNLAAQSLYEKFGFIVAGVRRRYYKDNGEDAYLMTLEDLESRDLAKLTIEK